MRLDQQILQVAAVGQGSSRSLEGNANLWKNKNSSPICLFLFSSNVGL